MIPAAGASFAPCACSGMMSFLELGEGHCCYESAAIATDHPACRQGALIIRASSLRVVYVMSCLTLAAAFSGRGQLSSGPASLGAHITFNCALLTIPIIIYPVLVAVGCCGARPLHLCLIDPEVLNQVWMRDVYACVHYAGPHLTQHSIQFRQLQIIPQVYSLAQGSYLPANSCEAGFLTGVLHTLHRHRTRHPSHMFEAPCMPLGAKSTQD